ncbi:MAG: M48 family metallopeptidase, partial [Pseudomonadota bacterium]
MNKFSTVREFAMFKPTFALICAAMLLSACTTSPTGRSQLILLPESQMSAMGVQAFEGIKKEKPIARGTRPNSYVRCIVEPITREVDRRTGKKRNWEVLVFEDDAPNAFALPGGKIGIHTGIMKPSIASNADQLAAVVGHEIAHVLANHGGERVSHQIVAQVGMAAAQIALKDMDSAQGQAVLGALGVGAQFGILLPFSRSHETEADIYGLELMASAGFDPRESVKLWQNMARASKGKAPPEWMSTHPGHQTRIRNLTDHTN